MIVNSELSKKYRNPFLFLTKSIILLLFLIINIAYSNAQHKKQKIQKTRILFVFDGSQSMAGKWESNKKISIARKFLIHIIDSLEQLEHVEMALRVYGHQSIVPPQDCNDTRLEVPFGINNAPKIRQKLRYLQPKGTTPIAHSLKLSKNDFPISKNCRNIIILITDGIEACDGDPCKASLELQKKGIILKPFVLGIGLDPQFKKTFACVGNYFNADNEENFEEVLDIVITQALNSTTAQVNLLDIDGNPTESNVNMTFYNKISGKIKYNYVHTINHRGNPDTLLLDPLITYNIVINTIPQVTIEDVTLTQGIHNIIAASTPRGFLKVNTSSNLHRNIEFIIREKEKHKTLNIQKVNRTEKYLIGKYDLEVLTLPKLLVNDIEIKQNHTTTIDIPQPGIATFLLPSKGFGSLYLEKDNKLTLIYNTNRNETKESLTLLPGNYRFVYRALNAKKSSFTISKSFVIKSGSSVAIQP